MKFLPTIITLLLTIGCLNAQVSNVRMVQRTDGNLMVDIWYDLSFNDDEASSAEILVQASNNNGSSWGLSCSSLTGDFGDGVTAGTDKHIVWDFYTDNPNTSGSQFKVRLTYYYWGTMTGNDGTVYKTIKIGNQWWMAENLKETKYRNGDDIDEITDGDTWDSYGNNATGARCVYNNNEGYAATFGYLYNWYACNDSRKIAPPGWHMSTLSDWQKLEQYYGVADYQLYYTGYRGGIVGPALKSQSGWSSGGNGNNVSRFNAKPGGERMPGFCQGSGAWGEFWLIQSSGDPGESEYRTLSFNQDGIARYFTEKRFGLSVRLVHD